MAVSEQKAQITIEDVTRFYPMAQRNYDIRVGAVLDIAFDYLLCGLSEAGVYRGLNLTFKGGTALRKYHLGHKSRFSFDLDFDVEPGAESLILEVIEQTKLPGFAFSISERRGHFLLNVFSDLLDHGRETAKIDFSTRGVWLRPEWRDPVGHPFHAMYPFKPPVVPVMNLTENLAEKLARWERVDTVRDLFDLAALGRYVDPASVAELWILKAHRNMTRSRRKSGEPACSVESLLATRYVDSFNPDDLVLPWTSSKEPIMRDAMRTVTQFCETVASHVTPELEQIASDQGAMEWQVSEYIRNLSTW
jgi:hypothetical protein